MVSIMDNYNKIKNDCQTNKCSLITTFDDFETKRELVLKKSYLYVRIEFVGICGHQSSAVYTNFKLRGTGKRCKECVKNDTKTKLKSNDKKQTNEIESESIKLITQYLSPYYEIVRMNEGCTVDIAIREINKTEDEWIPIQVKSTEKISHNMYSFRKVHSAYNNMLLICVCISEIKMWVIPYNDLNIKKSSLNISKKSKYNDYGCVDNLLLYKYIDLQKNKFTRKKLDDCLLPVSTLQQQEQKYIKNREKYVNFIEYTKLDIQNTSTDFKINNKKIQEKVTGYIKNKKSLSVMFAANNGKNDNGKRKFRTYYIGENDYYWIHSSIDDRFWIIPENILYENKYICDLDDVKSRTVLRIPINKKNNYGNKEWLKNYEYNYNQVDKDKIKKLFE